MNQNLDKLKQIKTLPSLIKYLHEELDWPIDIKDIDDLTFDYSPEELGLDASHAVKVKEIKQIRPLDNRQPWGIFWVSFEKKKLPIVVLRRIIGNLIVKKRRPSGDADRPSWFLNDLLFISSYGEEEHRNISFAHFNEDPENSRLPILKVLGWDDQNSILHFDRVADKLENCLHWPEDISDIDSWRRTWSEAFTDRYREAITSSEELINKLAEISANIRIRVREVLSAETSKGPMRQLLEAMKKMLIHDLNEDSFADMYAQTVGYGLLSARFSQSSGLTTENLIRLTSASNPFLESLLRNIFTLNKGEFHFSIDEVGISDVLELLNNTNIEAVKVAFSDRNPDEDPVIRFYEGFLKKYDSRQKIKRGVFFTPRPVVSFIVRSVHEMLQKEFGLEDGLASTDTWGELKKKNPKIIIPENANSDDPFVCILDPATGTGTFLFECIEVIEKTVKDKWCRELKISNWDDPLIKEKWNKYVPAYLLPRLYGYELMMAPYAIAHLKLSFKLVETGYSFKEKDVLNVYLTNSLEPTSVSDDIDQADLFTSLASEAIKVYKVKREKVFTVVIGNPPYSIISSNLSDHQRRSIEKYKYLEGIRIKEKGALQFEKNLNDDYIKFIAYNEDIITGNAIGILAFINNNIFLDGPTFRGMRWHLINSFNEIKIVDLHGSVKKSDRIPNGVVDKNVFDIQQGVSINIFIKSKKIEGNKLAKVSYTEIHGKREEKYQILSKKLISSFKPFQIELIRPFYVFVPRNYDLLSEYDTLIPVNELFVKSSTGIITARDNMVIDHSKSELLKKVSKFQLSKLTNSLLCESLGISLKKGWDIDSARRKLSTYKSLANFVKVMLYRPFDKRFIFYDDTLVWTTARPIMQNFLAGQNFGLMVCRQQKTEGFYHCLVHDCLVESCYVSNKTSEIGFSFPLYIYPSNHGQSEKGEFSERYPNLNQGFINKLSEKLKLAFYFENTNNNKGYTPIDVFDYVYAILHSPAYREKYKELLKTGFPKVPYPKDTNTFWALVDLGAKLRHIHLLESPKVNEFNTNFPNGGFNYVENGFPKYDNNKVMINSYQFYSGVSKEVWEFRIGAYEPAQKWLKDRRGCQLTEDDIEHYQKIIVALTETDRIMKEIDKIDFL